MAKYCSWRAKLILASKGVAMGVADVIPGVSGGTIAFISGIYEDLIDAISSVRPRHALDVLGLSAFFWNKAAYRRSLNSLREVHWHFLLPLLLGIIVAVLSMARLIPHLMRTFPFHAYSLFFGLIAVSCWFPFQKMERRLSSFAVLGALALATFLLMAPSGTLAGSSNPIYVFLSGAIAICALILPGISGAYILVLLGEYGLVLEALHNRDLVVVGTFIAGMAVGILSFVRLLKFLLDRHHSLTMAALTGIMVGSLRKIWPPNYAPRDGVTPGLVVMGVFLAVAGAILILALERVSASLAASDTEA